MSALLALIEFFGTGLYTAPYGIRISSTTLWRPALVASLAIALLLYRPESRQQKFVNLCSRILHHATGFAIVLGALAVTIAFRVSTFEAIGADSYGYISQAHLWASGTLVQHEPLSLRAPWPDADATFAPLGYRPGLERGTIVPSYSPGLPLLMAGLLLLFGREGPFLVVPLLGGLSIVSVFLLGRRVAGEACGLATALLLLTSPVFLFQLKEPMSDVPATAWWLLVILLTSTTNPRLIFFGGLAGSAAVLTRPNLVPLAAVVGLFILLYSAKDFRSRALNACLYSIAVIPGCVVVAVVNARLYGSPLTSGYSGDNLFKMENLWTNLSRYPRWLIEMETPFILLAVAGWFILRRGESSKGIRRFGAKGRFSNLVVAFVLVLYACYAIYLPFDNWTFLRFLLPAISLLLLLCGVAVSEFGVRLHSFPLRSLAVTCFVVFVAWRWDVMNLKPPRPQDRSAAVIGEYVRDDLPPNAIVLSLFHAGSIRYYSGRKTLRWDLLAPEWFDRSVTFLTTNGYHPFLLIADDWERTQFLQQFAGQSNLGFLSLKPFATYDGTSRADLYDLANPLAPSSTATITARSPR